MALSNSLKQAKSRGIAVVVISHRSSVLSVIDKILVLQDGAVALYGTQEEVQNRVKQRIKKGLTDVIVRSFLLSNDGNCGSKCLNLFMYNTICVNY